MAKTFGGTKKQKKVSEIYTTSLLSRTVYLNFTEIGANIKEVIQQKLSNDIEGKCDIDGFVKPNTCKVLSYSAGSVKGNSISFIVSFECLICCPVEGMSIQCIAKNITKAGIKAEIDEDKSPVVIFLARDHHYNNQAFSKINEGDKIKVKVIGQRFELNDEYISIIGKLEEESLPKRQGKKRMKIEILEQDE